MAITNTADEYWQIPGTMALELLCDLQATQRQRADRRMIAKKLNEQLLELAIRGQGGLFWRRGLRARPAPDYAFGFAYDSDSDRPRA